MFGTKALILILTAAPLFAVSFSGSSALQFTRLAVEFGPRPVDTPAHRKLEAFVTAKLRAFGCPVEQDSFIAETPIGPKRMTNIIAKVAGQSRQAVALTGHYDTKMISGQTFVGANDGGSSTGFLLEMARTLCGKPSKNDVYLVWLDGEEAIRNWTADDSLYGSRHLAKRWLADGTLRRLKALINVDMIGDGDLALMHEWNSTAGLRTLVWETAASLGYSQHFPTADAAVEDDHMPFLKAGAPALDLIDFNFGPGNSWWHTDQDTMDKLSAQSFQVVGNVLIKVLGKLEN